MKIKYEGGPAASGHASLSGGKFIRNGGRSRYLKLSFLLFF
jgi:hypothetical protein